MDDKSPGFPVTSLDSGHGSGTLPGTFAARFPGRHGSAMGALHPRDIAANRPAL
jgi:hypothetical protein